MKLVYHISWKTKPCLEKEQPYDQRLCKIFGISGEMQAKFYAVLVKSWVILQFFTFKGTFGNFLNIWQLNYVFWANDAFLGEIYTFFLGKCILAHRQK